MRWRVSQDMVSRIEPDRYTDTGFAVKDTSPEINATMRKTKEERLLMGFDMMATARALVWGVFRTHSRKPSGEESSSAVTVGMERPL